ncbi:MAG: DNA adenine methylase [Patescibacteria group bacterium UBA2163]
MSQVNSIPFTNDSQARWKLAEHINTEIKPPKQLLKWVGNKQRYATQIVSQFPHEYNRYIEPFVGSGAILATVAPKKGIAGDTMSPLIEMWDLLKNDPESIYKHYEDLWQQFQQEDRKTVYKKLLDSYNDNPNPLDLVFITRSCYGGIVRFTKQGRMSTPLGPHNPISPESFYERMYLWRQRIQNTDFYNKSFEELIGMAKENDVVYCDPPYVDSQSILYGAQAFDIKKMWEEIAKAKKRGAFVAVSIDGKKKSGNKTIELDIPEGLFEKEVFIELGSSMLRRFQKKDQTMEGEDVHDRLLITS